MFLHDLKDIYAKIVLLAVNCFPNKNCLDSVNVRPTSGGMVTLKLEDEKCQIQTPVAFVDLAVQSFP